VTDVKQYIRDRVVEVTESGCWIWMQTLNRGGYGMVLKRGMGQRTAHRLSYATFVGPIPEGMYICHRCDVRCCVNPDHLFVGTHTDNVRDAVRKKRMYNQRLTHCPRGHEYTPENTLLRKGNNARRCHTCRKVQDAANAARRLRRQKAVLGNWCNSKLNEEQVRYVLASQEPVSHLAYRIGISIDAVWRIKTGRSWKHIYRAAVAAETCARSAPITVGDTQGETCAKCGGSGYAIDTERSGVGRVVGKKCDCGSVAYITNGTPTLHAGGTDA
jgi:hypothetical protein